MPPSSRKAPAILALALFTLLPGAARATTITVGQGGAADYSVIQTAIDAATDGDEIIVGIGTYVENIHFNGKNIILRSTDPEDNDIITSTIIDGNTSGSVVTFAGTEGTTCVLAGFTITNGNGTKVTPSPWFAMGYGGGIYGNGALATIERNTITRNTLMGYNISSGAGLSGCDGAILANRIIMTSAK